MRTPFSPLWLLILACVLILPACQKRSAPLADKTSAVPYDVIVGVACFNQPLTTSELIQGSLPEKQGRIPADVLPQLDSMLRNDLAATKRLYTWLPDRAEVPDSTYHESGTPQALPHWTAYGRQYSIDLLLVPQVINWHQREGSGAGVTHSAHVRVEFFLLDVKHGRVLRRSFFEEKQVGLVDNILSVGDFLKRKGAWVTAEDLTREGIVKALKELGL